jgi:SOS response regulatory protein OraA/RecX
MGVTYTVSRIELKRTLTTLGMSEKNIDDLLAELNKMHRHANAVFFAGLLQKAGLKQEDVAKVLRRIGIDDINMTSIFSMLEEEKIKNAYGRVVEMSLE